MLYTQEEIHKVTMMLLEARLHKAQDAIGGKLESNSIKLLFNQLQRDLPWLRNARIIHEFDGRRRQWLLDIDYTDVKAERGLPGKPNINNKMVECFMCGRPNIEGVETCADCGSNM